MEYEQRSSSNEFYQSGYSLEAEALQGAQQQPHLHGTNQWGQQQHPHPHGANQWGQQQQWTQSDQQQWSQHGPQQWSQPDQQQWGQSQQWNNPQTFYPPTQGYGEGEQMEMDPAPGAMGQIMSTPMAYGSTGETGFDDEPPLLEELGIDFELIKKNTLSVLNPMQVADAGILSNNDLAGPLLFCLLFGGVLLLSGKVHFGYIYGVGLLGCVGMYLVLNLMSEGGVPVGCVFSVLGYCLLPMVLLSAVSVVLSLQGIIGTVLTAAIICWCSFAASKLFVSVLYMHSQQLLVAYPCALLYAVFALLTVF